VYEKREALIHIELPMFVLVSSLVMFERTRAIAHRAIHTSKDQFQQPWIAARHIWRRKPNVKRKNLDAEQQQTASGT
jgi:hypothetical protein